MWNFRICYLKLFSCAIILKIYVHITYLTLFLTDFDWETEILLNKQDQLDAGSFTGLVSQENYNLWVTIMFSVMTHESEIWNYSWVRITELFMSQNYGIIHESEIWNYSWVRIMESFMSQNYEMNYSRVRIMELFMSQNYWIIHESELWNFSWVRFMELFMSQNYGIIH